MWCYDYWLLFFVFCSILEYLVLRRILKFEYTIHLNQYTQFFISPHTAEVFSFKKKKKSFTAENIFFL